MPVEVRIPPVLRKHTGGQSAITVSGSTISELLTDLEGSHPGLRSQLVDERGQMHRFINMYRNGEDVRYLAKLDTAVSDGDVVAILPAVAGG